MAGFLKWRFRFSPGLMNATRAGVNCRCRTTEKERIMEWGDRIVSDPEILVGKPVIKGTGISVELVIGWLTAGRLNNCWSLTRISPVKTFWRRWRLRRR
jgi:hypothetical protein